MSENLKTVPKHLAQMRGAILEALIYYPRSEKPDCSAVEVGLCDVRAAGSIRVEYNFERDGYRILQQRVKHHDGWSEETGEWVEAAFVSAWLEVE